VSLSKLQFDWLDVAEGISIAVHNDKRLINYTFGNKLD